MLCSVFTFPVLVSLELSRSSGRSLQVWVGPAHTADLVLWGGFIANDSFSLSVEFPSLDESLGDMCPPGISAVMESATVTTGTNSSF